MSDEVEFLSDILSRPWSPDAKSGLQSVALFIGKGTNALEVAVAKASQATARSVLVETWKARKGRRAAPLLLGRSAGRTVHRSPAQQAKFHQSIQTWI